MNVPHIRVQLARVYVDSGNTQSARAQVSSYADGRTERLRVLRAAMVLEGL